MITTVTTSAGLLTTLKAAQGGDTILLAPGQYEFLQITGAKFSTPVTITSADPANPASVVGINIKTSQGLVFSDLDVLYQTRLAAMVGVTASSEIVFDRIEAIGNPQRIGNGFAIGDSTAITVRNSEISGTGSGIYHLNSNYLVFADNRLHDISMDGIRGGGSSWVTITGNHFTNFQLAGAAHNDAIQFWTQGTKTVTHDLLIVNNTFVRGDGQGLQGVFLANEAKIPYENVTITGNVITGGSYHGINLDYAKNAVVQGNQVQGYAGMVSWILVTHVENAKVEANLATAYIMHSNTDVSVTGNTLALGPFDKGDGTPGGDLIVGNPAGNFIRGMDGNDSIFGDAGIDDLNGNVGQDTVDGGDGADVVRGGQGDDLVLGGAGDDLHLNGNLGNDQVFGGDGADTVYGGQGDDTLYGEAGADQLSGDAGSDLLTGGAGADRFLFGTGGGSDWVADFNAAEGDRMVLAKGLAYTVTNVQGQAVIVLASGDQIGLAGVAPAQLVDWLTLV